MLKIVIHWADTDRCSLNKKKPEPVDGVLVTFEDGTVVETFLGYSAFNQLIELKAPRKPTAAARTNGKAVDAH